MKRIVLPLLAMVSLVSCVDDNYDLNRLNPEMNLFAEEGIEIPLSGDDSSDMNIFGSDNVAGNVTEDELTIDSKGEIGSVDLSKYDTGTLEKGLKLDGEYKFDLSDYSDVFRQPGTDIKFKDASAFVLSVNNGASVPLTISCEVLDGKKKESIGKVNDIEIPFGEGKSVNVSFNKVGMTYLPEEIIIKNIVIKAIPVKGSFSGTLQFLKAEFRLDSVVGKDTKFTYDFEDLDYFSGGIDVDYSQEVLNAKSLILKALYHSNAPVRISAIASGDITASLVLDGPTPEAGSPVELAVKCPKGIDKSEHVKVHMEFLIKDDIDLLDLDKYTLALTPVSLKFDEGIIVAL